MNSENQDSEKNGHKPSEKDYGLQTLALLQKIKYHQINPKSIGKKERKLLVFFLKAEGQTTAEIAHLLNVSDKTIERDKKALREEDTLTKNPKLVGQMAGRLLTETELCMERIRKSARGKDTPASVKVDAEHRCFQIFEKTIERLQSLGFLPTAAQKVTAEFTYQTEEVLTLEQIDKEVKRLQQIEGNPSEKEKTPDISPELAQKRRERLIALSRQKYARPQEKIRAELEKYKAIIEPRKPAAEVKKEKAELKQPVSSERPTKKTAPDRAEVLPEEKNFLKFISRHSGMFVTKIYKALQLSGYKGDKLKSSLIEKGLIIQEETRKGLRRRLAKVLTLTDKGANIVKKLPLRGKGGDLHRQLQDRIAEQAKVFGWKANIEKRISRSLESVDVELRKDDIRVAVEISSTSKPEQEIQNIKKCLEAGYDYILPVCPDNKRLSLLKTEAKKSFSFKERERIRFYHSDQVKNFFNSVGPQAIVSENGIVSGKITKQKEILSSEETADFLGISINTLYEWVSQKRIPHMKVGRLLKFKRGHLEKWLEKRVQKEESFDILDE